MKKEHLRGRNRVCTVPLTGRPMVPLFSLHPGLKKGAATRVTTTDASFETGDTFALSFLLFFFFSLLQGDETFTQTETQVANQLESASLSLRVTHKNYLGKV